MPVRTHEHNRAMRRVWLVTAALGLSLCACSGSSVAQDRAKVAAAQKAVAADQTVILALEAPRGSFGIARFVPKGEPKPKN